MKQFLLGIFLSFVYGTVSFAQTDYRITFTNKYQGDNFKPQKIYLFSVEDQMAIDSVEGENGVFVLKGKARMPQIASICGRATGFDVVATFILDEVPIRITLEKGVVISGSEVNARMNAISQVIANGGKAQMNIRQEAMVLCQKYNDQLPDSIARRLDGEWDSIVKNQISTLRKGIIDNKDNLIPAYFLLNYAEVFDVDFLDDFLSTYKYKDNILLESVHRLIRGAKRRMPGTMFTDFTLNDTEGKACKLSDYAGKGNYVLLDFWATWCAPCVAELPNLKKVYEEFHAKGFEIVGVSLDNDLEVLKKCIKEQDVLWPQFFDGKVFKNDATVLYNIRAIPATLLLAPDGKVIAENLRGEELLNKLKEIFD